MTTALTARRAILAPGQWVRNELWRRAKAVPSLDLRFADNKSLVDATTGQNLVDFTRASSGTYVGSDGLIKTATTNLLLRSEEFDNASWLKSQASVSSNTNIAPNGTMVADTLTEASTTSIHAVFQSQTFTAAPHAFTVFAKAAGRSFIRTLFFDGASSFAAYFDLSLGVVGTLTGTGTTATIVPFGNGWYRCSVMATTAAGTGNAAIRLASANGTDNYAGDGTSGVYIWGAQLEQSSTVGEYIPTTSTINSAPRFDHDPTTGESLGLLVEEQRTNTLLNSGNLTSGWTNSALTNTRTGFSSPDGGTDASRLQETTDSTSKITYKAFSGALVVGNTYTLSVFVKAGERFRCVVSDAQNAQGGYFNLNTKETSVFQGSPTLIIVDAPDGWKRCSITYTPTSTVCQPRFYILNATGAVNYTGDGASGLYIWGAQLEAGAFPTSYIPTTTTATVTRSADVASITGTNFSSWYRQDEGTWAADVTVGRQVSSASTVHFYASDGTTNEVVRLYSRAAGTTGVTVTDGGSPVVDVTPATAPIGADIPIRHAVAIAQNDFAASFNGQSSVTDGALSMPTLTRVDIGQYTGFPALNGTIRRLTFWPQRLSDSTLEAITQ